MKNDPEYDHLRQLTWRSEPAPGQEAQLRAWLAAHPEAQADWEEETGLTEALERLPDVPVASNFSARVLQQIERETVPQERLSRAGSWVSLLRAGWLFKTAFAVMLAGIGLFSYHQVQVGRRVEVARSVELVTTVASLPGPQVLEDFEAIRAMGQGPQADEELLALMQ